MTDSPSILEGVRLGGFPTQADHAALATPVPGQTVLAADTLTLPTRTAPDQRPPQLLCVAFAPCPDHPAICLPVVVREAERFLCPCCAQERRQLTYAAQRQQTHPSNAIARPAPLQTAGRTLALAPT